MSEKDGGPAFPMLTNIAHNSDWATDCGMSLRDYFAAHAPEPSEDEIGRQVSIDRSRNPYNEGPPKPKIRERYEIIAYLKFRYADAMLKEREK